MWVLFDGQRTVHTIGRTAVFHFVEDCPALKSAHQSIDTTSIDGQLTLEAAAEELCLSPCGTCIKMSYAISLDQSVFEDSVSAETQQFRVDIFADRLIYTEKAHKGRHKRVVSIPADRVRDVQIRPAPWPTIDQERSVVTIVSDDISFDMLLDWGGGQFLIVNALDRLFKKA